MPANIRVCVVGAGAAGLCAAYHLQKQAVDHVVFEQTAVPSGTWVCDDGSDPTGHSSMYNSLLTNLPVETMAFPGFPYPDDCPMFVHHSVVRHYLDYFYEREIAPHGKVRFSTKVIDISRVEANLPHSEGEGLRWRVQLQAGGQVTSELFSHVMVCNGKYSVPRMLDIPGASTFTGTIQHSHGYREPHPYVGKRVVIVGAGFSGVDIALEVVKVAGKVVISHRQKETLNLHPGIVEKPGILRIDGDRVYFGVDDFVEKVDHILLCTGYKISFPFLRDTVTVDDGFRVRDLFRHSVLISDPSIVFIGLPSRIVPCLLFDYQVRYAVSLFTGAVPLPSEDSMRRELAEDKRQRHELDLGALKFSHDLRGPLLWRYLQKFVDEGFGPFDPMYRRGHEAARSARKQDPANFRRLLSGVQEGTSS